jgi:hypothetical protein
MIKYKNRNQRGVSPFVSIGFHRCSACSERGGSKSNKPLDTAECSLRADWSRPDSRLLTGVASSQTLTRHKPTCPRARQAGKATREIPSRAERSNTCAEVTAPIDKPAKQPHMPPHMAAISHRIAGSGPRVAVVAPPRPRGRAAVVAGAAAKGAHRERTLEGASDDLRAAAAQCLDWAPARRRVRAAFAPVLPTLDHCLFKVRCASRSVLA